MNCTKSRYIVLTAVFLGLLQGYAQAKQAGGTDLKFEISFPASVSSEPLMGRMFVVITRNNDREPRLQVGRYGPLLLGVDFDRLEPGKTVVIDGATLGWPNFRWESTSSKPC